MINDLYLSTFYEFISKSNFRFEDVKDEIFDMVRPKDPLKITVQVKKENFFLGF